MPAQATTTSASFRKRQKSLEPNGAKRKGASTIGERVALGLSDPQCAALLSAAARGPASAVESLLAGGADPMCLSEDWQTPLALACKAGRLRAAKALLRAGCPLDERDMDRATALMLAAGSGHGQVAKMLIEAGASLDLRSAQGDTALSF